MKRIKLLLTTLLLTCLFATQGYSSHIKGGSISYTCIGPSTYIIELTIYRDCSGISLSSTASVSLSSSGCGSLTQSLTLIPGYPQDITPVCPTATTTCNSGTVPGMEKHVFKGSVTLPGSSCSQWEVAYSNCCRGGSIVNIMNSASTNMYISSTIDDSQSSCNSSPEFVYDGGFYTCAGDSIQVSNMAFEPDGDSMVFSLVSPMSGVGIPVIFNAGFSETNPFNGTINLNPATGDMTVSSVTAQSVIAGIMVEEYRNGVKIGEVRREISFFFSNCTTNDIPAITGSNGITGAFSATVNAFDTLTMVINVEDNDVFSILSTQTLSADWTNNLPGATLSVVNNVPTLTWIPTAANVGTHTIGVFVQDDACSLSGSATHSFSITVLASPPPPPPAPTYTSYNFAAGTNQSLCWSPSSGTPTAFNIVEMASNITVDTIFLNPNCILFDADSIGTDTLIMELCTLLGCDTIYSIINVDLGVWPGDTDTSGVVNNLDLLNIGVAYNATGTPRPNPTILWDGYLTSDWGTTLPNGMDYKFIDGDGDGVINAADTASIFANWGLSWNYKKSGAGNVPLYLDTDIPLDSQEVAIPIMLGDIANPANNFYGIAFSISYDTALVVPNSAKVIFDTTWLGTNGDLLSLYKDFYQHGEIQTAITRTNQANKSGMGRIGTLYLVIQDDILQKNDKFFHFDIHNITMIDAAANEIVVDGGTDTLVVVQINTNTSTIDLSNQIKVFPNPTTNRITIQTDKLQLEQIVIVDATGKLLTIEENPINGQQISLNQFTNGIYFLKIRTDKGIINKKIVLLR